MGSSIVVRRLQRDNDITVVGQGQSSFRNRGSGNVATQALELLTLMRLAGDSSMQREASLFGYKVVALYLFSSYRDCL
jgi:hypothetical protein